MHINALYQDTWTSTPSNSEELAYKFCHYWSVPMKTSKSHLRSILCSFSISDKFSHTCYVMEFLKLSRVYLPLFSLGSVGGWASMYVSVRGSYS